MSSNLKDTSQKIVFVGALIQPPHLLSIYYRPYKENETAASLPLGFMLPQGEETCKGKGSTGVRAGEGDGKGGPSEGCSRTAAVMQGS